MTIHFVYLTSQGGRVTLARSGFVACNIWPFAGETARKKEDVTCGNCLRTKVFRDA